MGGQLFVYYESELSFIFSDLFKLNLNSSLQREVSRNRTLLLIHLICEPEVSYSWTASYILEYIQGAAGKLADIKIQ